MLTKVRQMTPKIKIKHFTYTLLVLGIFVLGLNNLRIYWELAKFKFLHQRSIVFGEQVDDIVQSLANMDQILNQMTKLSSKFKAIAEVPEQLKSHHVADQNRKMRKPTTEIEEKLDLRNLKLKVKELESEAIVQEKTWADLDEFYSKKGSFLASIPSIRPVIGYVTSAFGFRRRPAQGWKMHEGVDIAAYYGTQVVAPAAGMVEEVSYSLGYGRYLVIDHGFGIKTRFAHTSKILVKPGQFVARGKRIALVGNSGASRGVHLHYEVRLRDIPVDPQNYMLN